MTSGGTAARPGDQPIVGARLVDQARSDDPCAIAWGSSPCPISSAPASPDTSCATWLEDCLGEAIWTLPESLHLLAVETHSQGIIMSKLSRSMAVLASLFLVTLTILACATTPVPESEDSEEEPTEEPLATCLTCPQPCGNQGQQCCASYTCYNGTSCRPYAYISGGYACCTWTKYSGGLNGGYYWKCTP
jgi:hypothetical protein